MTKICDCPGLRYAVGRDGFNMMKGHESARSPSAARGRRSNCALPSDDNSRACRCRALAAICILAATSVAAQDTTGVGAISGVVVSAAGQRTAGVRVCALDSASCATSDAQGAFRLGELRAGAYRLEILPLEGLPIVSEAVTVRAGTDGSVAITLPAAERFQQTVTVSPPAFQAPAAVKNSSFLVETREIRKGAAALQDVSRYVQGLPGVVIGTDDFRNDIIVRGGSPLENLFLVDNVEIPNINAFANFASAGGTVSLLDAELLQDVTFLTGGYPAPYINRTSSVLQVTQREGNRQAFAASATLGFAGAGAIVEGPIHVGKGTGKGSWVVSARRSFLDLFTRDVGFGGVPVVYSFNVKGVYDLTPRDRIWTVAIAGIDKIRLGLSQSTSLDDELANFDIRYHGWRSATGVNWQRTFGSRGVGLLGITRSEAKVGQRVKDLVAEGAPEAGLPVEAVIARSPVVYSEESRESETTLKYDLTVHLPLFDTVQAGGSFKTFRIGYAAASPYGNDTPYSRLPGIDPFALDTRFRSYQTGAYLQATKQLARRVSGTLGGRVDHYAVLSQARLSPRAGVQVRLTDALSWNSSAGSYYQQPSFLFVSAFPRNASLLPWRADHYVTGLVWSPEAGLRVTAEAYRKTYSKYPVASDLPTVSLANIGDTFDVREILFPLTSAGRGYSEGVELFMEKRLAARLYGQGNLSLSRTRHAGLDGVLRPGSFDYPFVFNVTGGYRRSPAWEFSARASFLSGRPFTPFDEALSTAQRRGVYDLSRVNAQRAPDYGRVDMRVDRTFTAGGRPLTVFVGVQNITNRRNFATYSWNRRTNARQFGAQQGIFPILGFDWRFSKAAPRPLP